MDSKSEIGTAMHLNETSASDSVKLEREQSTPFTGAVKIVDGDVTYLVPTPSADPRDPLNLPRWRKLLLLLSVTMYGTISLSMVGGLGGLIPLFSPAYLAEGRTMEDISDLMTYPTLFMGIGNIVSMPIANAIGRRPVFLASALLLTVFGVICVVQNSYQMHFVGRIFLGLAAGQSEALCPTMVQETQFLHERAKNLLYLGAMTNIGAAVYNLLGSYIGAAVGVSGWYAIGAGISGVAFIMGFFFAVETQYPRPLSAFQGRSTAVSHFASGGEVQNYTMERLTTTDARPLDTVNFKPRTLKSSLRLLARKPNWSEWLRTTITVFKVMIFPDMIWIFLLNGVALGASITLSSTYANVLTHPPYNWPRKSASFPTAGIIVVAFIAMPLLGHGSDYLIKRLARRNGGVTKPEFRLIPGIIPTAIGVAAHILYGQVAHNPHRFHWFAIVFCQNSAQFAFIGAYMATLVYTLDSYPSQAGAAIVSICTMRGVLSFATSYAMTPFINRCGFNGAFLIYGLMLAALGLMGIGVFIWGEKIRGLTSRFIIKKEEREATYT